MSNWLQIRHVIYPFFVAGQILLSGCLHFDSPTKPEGEFIQKDGAFISRYQLPRNSRVDGRQRLEYGLKPDGENYEGWFSIQSETGHQLWNDKWRMKGDDLHNLLLVETGEQQSRKSKGEPCLANVASQGVTVKDWVENIFNGRLHYGIDIGETKLKAGDLNLNSSAKRLNTTKDRLKDAILSQPVNLRIAYCSTWREDYNELVFVPAFNQYVWYGSGGY